MDNKMHEMLQNFIKEEEEKGEKDIEKIIQKFMLKYNNGMLDDIPNTPMDDAYELLDKAYETKTPSKAKKLAEQALEVCPGCFDAKLFLLNFEKDLLKKEEKLDKALEEEKERLTKEGFFEKNCIGCFYGIFETRPYIKGLYMKASDLASGGKYTLAKETCEEIIRLNENDNTGARYLLMAIYATLEDEKSLLKIKKQYNEENLEMLVPELVLNFKLGRMDKVKEIVDKIKKVNINFLKYFKGKMSDELDAPKGYYSFGGTSEVLMYLNTYFFLIMNTPAISKYLEKVKL